LQAFAPDVSSPTAYVINRTLAKNPEDRYQTYDELIEHLEYARTQLLENSGKARQPKARVVVEDEKQQSMLGYIMMAMIGFVIVMGGILYLFHDRIVTRHTGVEDLARLQMERSHESGEQILAAARKQMLSGKVDRALETIDTLSARPALSDDFKMWIPIHECIANLIDGQVKQSVDVVVKLLEKQGSVGGRGETERYVPFLTTLNGFLQSKDKISPSAVKHWNPDQFESIGILIAGLKEWDASRFESASGFFQKFLATKPQGSCAWIADFKPLAQDYRNDYLSCQALQTLIESANTPEKKKEALKQIPSAKAKLNRPGRLPEKLSAYEATLRAGTR